MKISWGTGILIGIIIFVVLSVTMTVIFMTQDVSLVSNNYYEKSLVYQDEIDKQNRTKSLDEGVMINFDGSTISIHFPQNYAIKNTAGEIYFYRPSDEKLDFKIPLQLSETGNQLIPTQRIEKGMWRLKLNWTMNENEYYNEKAIIIE